MATVQTLHFTCHKRLSPTSWAFRFLLNDPGVPIRSTPGFMLSQRFAGSVQSCHQLVQIFLKLIGHKNKTEDRESEQWTGHLRGLE